MEPNKALSRSKIICGIKCFRFNLKSTRCYPPENHRKSYDHKYQHFVISLCRKPAWCHGPAAQLHLSTAAISDGPRRRCPGTYAQRRSYRRRWPSTRNRWPRWPIWSVDPWLHMATYRRCEPWCWYIYLQNWVIFGAHVDNLGICTWFLEMCFIIFIDFPTKSIST